MTMQPQSSAGQLVAVTGATGYVGGRLVPRLLEAGYRVHDLRMRLVTLDQQRAALEVERAALARPQRIAHFARTQLGLVHAEAALATPPPAKGFATAVPPPPAPPSPATEPDPASGGQP